MHNAIKNKTLYLIGNGFDLHHGLLTGYNHYKDYLRMIDNNLVELIDKKIDEVLTWPYCENSKKEIEMWSRLEEYLGMFHDLDFDSKFDDVMANSEDDMERASYYDSPRINAKEMSKDYKKIILGIKKYFDGWIDSIDLTCAKKDINLDLDENGIYINFNYTKTLECVYNIPKEKVFHIHVENGKYILGHNDVYNIPFKEPHYDYVEKSNGLRIPVEDFDLRHIEVREELNSLYDAVFKEYYKNSERIIGLNKFLFNESFQCSKLIIMGLSLGKEDEIYIEELSKGMKNLTEIVYYFHTDEDLYRTEDILDSYFQNIARTPIEW